jgi:quinol monooxygenase YgiN
VVVGLGHVTSSQQSVRPLQQEVAVPLVVVTRYLVPPGDAETFRGRAREALDALLAQPGCRRGNVGRSLDDPDRWVLATEWDSTGSYRRALSSYDVKLRAVPVMYHAIDEPTAYESLVEGTEDGLADHASDRDPSAATASPGRRADR